MTSYLRVVEFQGSSSIGVAIISINWVNWILEINRRSLGRAEHETNNTTEIKDKKTTQSGISTSTAGYSQLPPPSKISEEKIMKRHE